MAGRRPHELSGGQKQRCSIARALIGAPKLLLLDEPARGLDAPLRAELYAVLRQVRAEFSTPILLVTHDLDECFELGDEMLVLREGRLVQSGTPRKVVDRPANVEVARLLGLYNLLAGRDSSRSIRGATSAASATASSSWPAPTSPATSRATGSGCACGPSSSLRQRATATPGPNQVPAQLERVVDKPSTVRLEFAGGIAVEMPRAAYEPLRETKDWVIEFPPESLRVV